ncbi:MAG: hypothetical protein MR215_10570 [Bacteroidales bacterium]|nr:hypothetical protein [Bacteroidales bacterium]
MRKSLLSIVLAVVTLAACHESDSTYWASGIGSVELSDSVFTIHYYKTSLRLADDVSRDGLTDTSRVFFTGSGKLVFEDTDGNQVYDFRPTVMSSDIATPILMLDSAGMASDSLMRIASSAEGFYAQNLHITRDWRRNDYFDATAIYQGSGDGSDDFFSLVGDTLSADADTMHLWLRLARQKTDSARMITKHVSIPVNCLRDSTKERILLRLSRIDAFGDTVVSDYVYSYVNFIE